MINDLEQLFANWLEVEEITFIEMFLIGLGVVASVYLIFNIYGIIALVTWYLTRYFTKKEIAQNEY